MTAGNPLNTRRGYAVQSFVNSEQEDAPTSSAGAGNAVFATTHWSVVLQAGLFPGSQSEQAMEKLCRAYYYPLYAYTRRLGHPPPDAQDLTQGFFLHLLETNLVGKADAGKGRFRSFLLASIKNFIASERDRARAQKRGGGRIIISVDDQKAEGRFTEELVDRTTPEMLFERAWATAVLDQALEILVREYQESGKDQVFERLRPFLLGDRVPMTYAMVAESLGTTEGAVKMLVQRLRKRYREILREVVGQSVESPDQIEDELRHLRKALSN